MNQKAKYIKNLAKEIKENFDGKVPEDYDTLIKIKGLGSKMVILFLQAFHNKNVGICVDTHVHRISNRLNWVNTKRPEETRH